jgi:PAS domain S-box-containing protein
VPHASRTAGPNETSAHLPDALFAEIAAISADAIITIDEQQRILFFNSGAEEIFGYCAAEAAMRPLTMLLPERFRAGHDTHIARFGAAPVRARRMGERQEISGMRKNGEEFPAEASISKISDNGRLLFTVVLRDITERKRAADRLHFLAEAGEALAGSLDSDQTLALVARLAVPTLGDACLADVDYGGLLHRVASAHVDPNAELILRDMARRFPPDPAGALPAARVLRTHDPVLVPEVTEDWLAECIGIEEHREMFRQLRVRSIMAVPLIAHGRSVGALSFHSSRRGFGPDDVQLAADLARRAALAIDNARLHDELHAAIRARDEMMGIVSHDLRNPVQAIKMLAAAISASPSDGRAHATAVEHATVIRRAAQQMDTLIQDLLDVVRIDAGQLHVQPRAVGVEELLSAALETLEPLAEAKMLTLTAAIEPTLPEVAVDAERIAQVLSNLVGNAIKFTPEGGEITVSADAVDGVVRVRVSDTGPGIPADQLGRVFDRFWQSRRSSPHGAGLGLSIAKGIVEAHGGRISASSQVGAGTTFSFTMPVAQ